MSTITLINQRTGQTIEVDIAEPAKSNIWLNVAGLLGSLGILATLAFVAIVF